METVTTNIPDPGDPFVLSESAAWWSRQRVGWLVDRAVQLFWILCLLSIVWVAFAPPLCCIGF